MPPSGAREGRSGGARRTVRAGRVHETVGLEAEALVRQPHPRARRLPLRLRLELVRLPSGREWRILNFEAA